MRTSKGRKPFAGIPGRVFLGLTTAAWPLAAQVNVITNTANGTLAGTVAYVSLIPGQTTAVTPGQVQFRLRSTVATGYRVDASATFTPTPTAPVAGGVTIAASDIGVGITSITLAANVYTPRTDTIPFGFDYDPTTAVASTGVTPYLGAASGQATLADLSGLRTILSGPRIAPGAGLVNPNYLTVTMKFGLLPQYFTPCTFTATITLTISNGP